ncbi:MAG: ATP-binding protein [Bacteroidota bacterium]|nr:ATP-binding protein [Bacteroidota bacterium]
MSSEDTNIIESLIEVVRLGKLGLPVHYDFSNIPTSSSSELNTLRKEIESFASQYNENYSFILNLSKGNLNTAPPAKNGFANHYKQLQADLLHLTWQIQQISEGDLNQKVCFSGDFSKAINKMVDALKEKQDISDQNEHYVNELKELNATKDKFFSIISHDLKNPFAGLLGISDILISEIQEKQYDSLDEYAKLIKDFSEQGYKLLINLLDWSRSQRNTIQVDIKPQSLAAVIDNAKAANNLQSNEKNIKITCTSRQDYLVLADANMLNTIMRNLLSNAIKFTNEGGEITISDEVRENKLVVSVTDNGIGIKPENIGKLFRIDTNFTTKGTRLEEGTGLGLILCKDFLKKMDGDIWLISEEGKGSTFSFSLPLA